MSARRISINQQIEELDRELAQRAQVYPRLVASGRMRQAIADFQVERLQADKRTLEWVRDNRERLLAAALDGPP